MSSPTHKAHLSTTCECGARIITEVGHYDIARCPKCDCRWWALQPKRNGPLKLFLWPGPTPLPAR